MTTTNHEAATLRWAQAEAQSLIRQHVPGWRFEWDSARRRFGQCRPASRTISMSRYLITSRTRASVRDTILHEIAHALTPGHGHDRAWKAACRRIGADPTRTRDEATVPPRWRGTCGNCSATFPRHRRQSGIFCAACGPRKGLITWTDQGVSYRAR